jgi:plastocyanin
MRGRLIPLLLLVFVFACSREGGARVDLVEGRRYEPQKVTVIAGETVTWTNQSSEAHSVTAYKASVASNAEYFSSGGFDSEEEARGHVDVLMTTGDTFSVRFDHPGTYRYFCIPHEDQGMRGTIVVEG